MSAIIQPIVDHRIITAFNDISIAPRQPGFIDNRHWLYNNEVLKVIQMIPRETFRIDGFFEYTTSNDYIFKYVDDSGKNFMFMSADLEYGFKAVSTLFNLIKKSPNFKQVVHFKDTGIVQYICEQWAENLVDWLLNIIPHTPYYLLQFPLPNGNNICHLIALQLKEKLTSFDIFDERYITLLEHIEKHYIYRTHSADTSNGSLFDVQNSEGLTALDYLLEIQDYMVINVVLDVLCFCDINLNRQDKNGATIMHKICQYSLDSSRYLHFVKTMKIKRADFNIKDKMGHLPIYYVHKYPKPMLLFALEEAGATIESIDEKTINAFSESMDEHNKMKFERYWKDGRDNVVDGMTTFALSPFYHNLNADTREKIRNNVFVRNPDQNQNFEKMQVEKDTTSFTSIFNKYGGDEQTRKRSRVNYKSTSEKESDEDYGDKLFEMS